ncbi:hypothetical protein AVEN_239871-1 [Araneus ventricosus]|uniref:Uncharacterized protein n=1 Tax=Araneus ventricosus TaxID=182803 RepID=A0A4Y2WWW3_ARAVE|nr:hypothetical protein AVEN_239871-1 [Araneus ventricosus]
MQWNFPRKKKSFVIHPGQPSNQTGCPMINERSTNVLNPEPKPFRVRQIFSRSVECNEPRTVPSSGYSVDPRSTTQNPNDPSGPA